MNFSEQFISIVDNLASKLGIVVDWSSKNIMPYLQDLFDRLIKYEIYSSAFYVMIFVLTGYIAFRLIKWMIKELGNSELLVFVIAPMFFILTMCLLTISQVMDIIQALTIPEKTVIEMIQMYIPK